MSMKTLFALLSVAIVHAATTLVITPTATQAVIRIQTDQDGNCTVQASEGAAIGTPVNDIDTTKFAASNSDARAGSIVGDDHIFVLGTRTAAKALDGRWYSRALQANTPHTVQVTCGGDVVTQSFSTLNPPLGDIAGETLPFDSAAPYNAALPSIDMSMTNGLDTGQAASYIDPLTGFLLKRVTGGTSGALTTINPGIPPTAFDLGSVWTTPSKAVGTSGFATIGTSGSANALFVPLGLPSAINYITFGQWDVTHSMDDLNLSINGSGSSATAADRTMSACVSLHHGAGCDTDTLTVVFPQTNSATRIFPGATATSWNPFWKLWTTAHAYPASIDLGTRTGTATMSGTTITWSSGALFSNRLIAGDRIQLVGSGCNNGGTDYCTVARVTDSQHIVTMETASVSAASAFTIQNAGLLIWKNNGAGTVSINTVRYYAAFGTNRGTSVNEQKDTCSPNTFSLAINRDGSARPASVLARLCQFQAGDARHAVYAWVPSTGEAWHVGNAATIYPGPGGADTTYSGGACSQQAPAWHPTDPFSWYCVSGSGIGPYYQVVLKFTYNYVAGVGSCNGREWNDATYGAIVENPCVGVVNDTPASANQDLITLFKAFDPSFDSAYFPNMTVTGGIGKYLVFSFTASGQNSMAYYGWYDVVLKRFVKSADTFRTYPIRWGTSHGNSLIHNTDSTWSVVQVNSEQCYRSQCTGNDLSEMAIVSIAGRSDNNLPSDYFTPCPFNLDARWVALGAVGGSMNCVQITMDGEPRMENPSASDKAKWPASALNPAWAQIQTIAEGDELGDNGLGTYTERLLVVKKTAGNGNQIVLDILRAPQWIGIGNCGTPVAHTAPWVPVMYPTGQCYGGSEYWVNIAGNAASIPETQAIGGLHSDSSGIGPLGGVVAARLTNRLGAIPVAAGSPSYVGTYSPSFNGSDPAGWAASNAPIAQSHLSSRQIQAPLSEQGWIIDGHPYGGGLGAGSSPICTLGSVQLQGGTIQVYKLTLAGGSCPAALDMKNFPLEVLAGRFILGDLSSAATGNVVADSTPYKWCYARAADECRAGSSSGDIYASIPFGETGTACSFSNFDINAPCVFAKYGLVGNLVQADVTQPDITAAGTRRLGYGLTVPTHPSNYWSGTTDPDGQWAFFSPVFADNMVVNQYFAYKLPPTPPRDNVARNSYVSVPVTINNAVDGDIVRVRFGYAEFGPVDGSSNSLYCTSRAESCYSTGTPTITDPFVFAGEGQSYTACTPACTVNVPALSNHVLYYTFDRKNGSDVSTSQVQAVAVP
jgi:hypothetical protein